METIDGLMKAFPTLAALGWPGLVVFAVLIAGVATCSLYSLYASKKIADAKNKQDNQAKIDHDASANDNLDQDQETIKNL